MCVRQEVSHSYDEGCCVGEIMGRQHLLKLGILWHMGPEESLSRVLGTGWAVLRACGRSAS